jgi:3-phenylpropionate/trans-cinnamate dioxygenase ferredoxin reductase component
MMLNYDYLIVGGGMTAAAAVAGIREIDRTGTIGLIGAEPHPPYDRPPLSKALWKGDPLDSIWRNVERQGVTSHLGRTVRSLDASDRHVVDDHGVSYTYGKLLLATGCTPRRLPFGEGKIIYFRTVEDWQRVHAMLGHGKRIAIVGGGFIASELAASLANNDQHVVMIFPGEGIGSRMYPPELAAFLNGVYREKGVEVLAGSTVTGCELRDEKAVLAVRGDPDGAEREVQVDGVVAGIGVQPNVELAKAAGLTVEDGIRVDSSLRTSDPRIYAAGDVASFYDPALNEWRRVEHADNATTMGGFVGVAMAGRTVVYDHTPFFYSDFFDFGYEAVGHVDSRLEMVTDWTVPCHEGVIYYLRDGRVRGVLLWNIWGQVDAARRLIGPESRAVKSLVGLLGKTREADRPRQFSEEFERR